MVKITLFYFFLFFYVISTLFRGSATGRVGGRILHLLLGKFTRFPTLEENYVKYFSISGENCLTFSLIFKANYLKLSLILTENFLNFCPISGENCVRYSLFLEKFFQVCATENYTNFLILGKLLKFSSI